MRLHAALENLLTPECCGCCGYVTVESFHHTTYFVVCVWLLLHVLPAINFCSSSIRAWAMQERADPERKVIYVFQPHGPCTSAGSGSNFLTITDSGCDEINKDAVYTSKVLQLGFLNSEKVPGWFAYFFLVGGTPWGVWISIRFQFEERQPKFFPRSARYILSVTFELN